MANDDVVCSLDHAWKYAQSTWERRVFVEYATAALLPLLYWCIDGFLHLGPVEVDLCALGEIIETTGEAQDTTFVSRRLCYLKGKRYSLPQDRACCCDLVNVEAGVDKRRCEVDVIPQVAVPIAGWGCRKGLFGWEHQIVLQECCVPTRVRAVVNVCYKALVQVQDRAPVVDERCCRNWIE